MFNLRNTVIMLIGSITIACLCSADVYIEQYKNAADEWTGVFKNFVLQPKEGPWSAYWIGPAHIHSDENGRVFLLRKKFVAQDPAEFSRVYVSADSKYKLWVNGKPAARGPVRFDPQHQQYDVVDLSGLIKPGTNLVAAEVIYWGPDGPIFQMSARPGFLLECSKLKTDKTWKVLVNNSQRAAPWNCVYRIHGYLAGNWLEEVDGKDFPVGWQFPEFDDTSWANAEQITRVENWGEGDTRAPWKLIPRSTPPMEERAAVQIQPVQTGVVNDTKSFPPFSFETKPFVENPAYPISIPNDNKTYYVIFDAGRLVTGYPQFEFESSAGAIVEIMYAEAPSINFKKDTRNSLNDKRVEGYADIYITRDGKQIYEPFLHRTFWFIRIAVKTTGEFKIHNVRYRWTGYPFEERGKFECSDPELNKIWTTGWYTARLCAHETYEDCPYYEQLQYVGDTRIQALITYYASGDPRLPALAIRHLNASRIPEGLTYSRYPSHIYQIIPGFSLFWILMLDDYYQHVGDTNIINECASGIFSVLKFFENYISDKGFISNPPYWNFHDWNFEGDGTPPGSKENCTLTTLLYKGALDAASRLFYATGDEQLGSRFSQLSKQTADAINKWAWSDSEGLYTDGIQTKSLSQHVNIYAILFNVADENKRQKIAQRLFTDSRLRQTTFYFAYYLHQVASILGKQDFILNDLGRWKAMFDLGTSTFWETPGNSRSDCHAWSASPTCVLMQEILGVRPLKPGYAEALIKPYTQKLKWARGSVPTPQGQINVQWEKTDKFIITVDIPQSIKGIIVMPSGEKHTAGPGKHTFTE